jgi:hypothetical protein
MSSSELGSGYATASADAKNIAAKLKQLSKFSAMFYAEGKNPPFIKLLSEPAPHN